MAGKPGDNAIINVININGHQAVITFDSEIDIFRGGFIGLNSGADCYAYSVEQLRKESAESLRIFLDECKKDRIKLYKPYSGKVTTC